MKAHDGSKQLDIFTYEILSKVYNGSVEWKILIRCLVF